MSSQWVVVVTEDGIYFIEAESIGDYNPSICNISQIPADSTFVNCSWDRIHDMTVELWTA